MILLQCIYSVVGTHLDCFQLETNMNYTAMYIFVNIQLHAFLCSRTLEELGMHISDISRLCQTASQSSNTNVLFTSSVYGHFTLHYIKTVILSM